MDKLNCSTPEAKYTKIRQQTPLDLSKIEESPNSFDSDIQSRGSSFVSTPISTRYCASSQPRNFLQQKLIDKDDSFREAKTSNISSSKKRFTPRRCSLGSHRDSELTDPKRSLTKELLDVSAIVNPFESYLLDRLHTHTCSPSIFAKVVSPSDEVGTKENFWSIDHMALVDPVDIDVSSFQQTASMKTDHETESRIQATVEQYFAESLIAPSPWIENGGRHHRRSSFALLPNDANNHGRCSRSSSLPNSPLLGGNTSSSSMSFQTGRSTNVIAVSKTGNKTATLDKSITSTEVQTEITLPPDFDLAQMLGEKFLYKEINSFDSQMSTSDLGTSNSNSSSLRRKLFGSATKKSKHSSRDEHCSYELENC